MTISSYHGSYLEIGSSGALEQGTAQAKWTVERNFDNKIHLKDEASGKYLGVGPNGVLELNGAPGSYEELELVPKTGCTFYVKLYGGWYYLAGGSGGTVGVSGQMGHWEEWTLSSC